MASFFQDPSLPSHGKKAKAENVGSILIKLSHSPALVSYSQDPTEFKMFINISVPTMSYSATVESEFGHPYKKHVIPVEIPDDVIDEVLKFVNSDEFQYLVCCSKNISTEMVMDGHHQEVSIRTNNGNLKLDSDQCYELLTEGVLDTVRGEIVLPISDLAKIAFETLGIDPEEE